MPPALNLLKRLTTVRSDKSKPRGRKKKAKKTPYVPPDMNQMINLVMAGPLKPNPYYFMALLSLDDLIDAMDKWMLGLNPHKSMKEIEMFHHLKTQMPFSLTREFFVAFAQATFETDILRYFRQFKKYHEETIRKAAVFVKSRKATSLGPYVYKEKPYVARFKPRLPKPRRHVTRLRYSSEFLPLCESEYRRAPWVTSRSPVIGVVLNATIPSARQWTIPVKVGDDGRWAKVKENWYSHVCKHGRAFIPDMVGYLTANGTVIEETEEIYDAIGRRIAADDEAVTEKSLDAAKILLNRAYPNLNTDMILNKLVGIPTNTKLGKTLSRMIVFTTKLINRPQIYHTWLKQGRYVPGDVPFLTKYDMLPEVFENPRFAYKQVLKTMIRKKRHDIEADFHTLRITLLDPSARTKGRPSHVHTYRYPNVDIPDCQGIDDPIYFREKDTMYCLPRQLILDADINPHSGIRLPDYIKTRAKQLKDVVTPSSPKGPFRENELAPGLFDALKENLKEKLLVHKALAAAAAAAAAAADKTKKKKKKKRRKSLYAPSPLREEREEAAAAESAESAEAAEAKKKRRKHRAEEEAVMSSAQCAQCYKKVVDPKFKSIYKGNTVEFCDKDCFDAYEFKDK